MNQINTLYIINKKTPSNLDIIWPVWTIGIIMKVAINKNIKWLMESIACNGINKALIPRIRKILKTFDPSTLPIAISDFPLYAAIADTTSSGREVPIATIDNAITNLGILRISAIVIADSINNQAPITTPKIPIIIKIYFFVLKPHHIFHYISFHF